MKNLSKIAITISGCVLLSGCSPAEKQGNSHDKMYLEYCIDGVVYLKWKQSWKSISVKYDKGTLLPAKCELDTH